MNGWGMDPEPFSHITSNSANVLHIYDYSKFNFDDVLSELRKYQAINIIAWSMGVWAAQFIPLEIEKKVSFSVAINGTLKPIDKNFGINPSIFNTTLSRFSTEIRDMFFKNMFENSEDFNRFSCKAPLRQVEDQKNELENLKKLVLSNKISDHALFDTVITGKNDKIIPARSQKRFWKDISKTIEIDEPHFPFFRWNSWEEIIEFARDYR